MKLVSFRRDADARVGARHGRQIADLHELDAQIPPDILGVLRGGEDLLERARSAVEAPGGDVAWVDVGDVQLLPVIPQPPKILCVGRNYADHASESGHEVSGRPNIFLRTASSLIADGEPIQVPSVSDQVDWEAELAVVIGRPGKHISRSRAFEHVAGYAIFNDVSIRDFQIQVPAVQWAAGKNFDASGPFGPDLVTADEIEDPHDLELTLEVNSRVMQRASTAEMIFGIPELIEYISSYSTLEVGDVIATGTPAGVGRFREPPVYLRPGDSVRIEIASVGVQESPVVAEGMSVRGAAV